MIGKCVYFFWGKNTAMSWLRYMTLYSFRKLNPDWHMVLYISNCPQTNKTWRDDVLQDFFEYQGPDYLPRVKELDVEIREWTVLDQRYPNMAASHKSNFFKWHILDTCGGVYSDMDIIWVAPIDKFYEAVKDYDVGICYSSYLSIGLLWGKQGNYFYNSIYNNSLKTYDARRYQCVGVESVYNWLYTERIYRVGNLDWEYVCAHDILKDIKDRCPNQSFYNIPTNLVYPYPHDAMDRVFREGTAHNYNKTVDAIGVHWYAGTRQAQEYNNRACVGNYREFDNTMKRLLEVTL